MTNSDARDAAAEEQLVEVAVDANGVVIVADSSAVVDELYARIKDRGYVTTGEIFAALPKLEPETQELADIYASFNARGVQVIDEIEEELRAEDANRGRQIPDVPAPTSRAATATCRASRSPSGGNSWSTCSPGCRIRSTSHARRRIPTPPAPG